jgi:Acetyltransferase (GNAT) family
LTVVLIRRATRADLEQARVLYDEFHAFHVRGVPSHLRIPAPEEVDAAAFDRAIERLVEGEDATLLVAESDGRLVGFAEVYVDPPAASAYVVPRTTATLQSLLVTDGFQRHRSGA